MSWPAKIRRSRYLLLLLMGHREVLCLEGLAGRCYTDDAVDR